MERFTEGVSLKNIHHFLIQNCSMYIYTPIMWLTMRLMSYKVVRCSLVTS